jgi:hypothetical protein
MKIDGIEVVDADRPLVLHIRTPDAKTGKPKDPENCAAAKAACRIPGVILAKVYRTRTYLLQGTPGDKTGKSRRWRRYLTPDSLRGEIIALDRGGSFEPDDYELPAPPKSMRLGAKLAQPTGRRTGKKKRVPHIVRGIRPHGPGKGGGK